MAKGPTPHGTGSGGGQGGNGKPGKPGKQLSDATQSIMSQPVLWLAHFFNF